MAQSSSCSNQQSNKEILEQLLANFQCAICVKFPQNTHICPSCSAMYCFDCIRDCLLATDASRRNKCAKCSKTHLNALIKLRCFDDMEQLGIEMGSLDLNGGYSPPVDESESVTESGTPELELEEEVECTEIPVGRVEPVEGLPKAVEGTFTLRNIHRCKLEHVCSERVTDEMGFIWRMRVYPNGYREQGSSKKMHVWVEMLYGEPGFYEVVVELRNFQPLAYRVKKSVVDFIGVENLIDIKELPRGRIDLSFRYTIRPANYKAKVTIQQILLNKHARRIQLLKGESETFEYRIMEFSGVDWDENYLKKFTDKMLSSWSFGLHGKHRFAEFQLTLVDGPPDTTSS
ncbi:uncharacterized protein LOC129780491 isoform X2 [Toxorhynchites rutilus septentrionalis]|uniref:uncharacterized protein LOC129780491 isoform X2 n=1 Tax=Toxorhynchites rutilus septentrionalis TaxID=329112 RepID=UPI00247A0D2E|nr:uncharacterized protein LOC129780491 isoform X2 [Toxorhynchites rutilus septentrionalis]